MKGDCTVTVPTRSAIFPGQPWLDTAGNRIQAHGGSIITVNGVYYWYGENKEHTVHGGDVWHWGVRCYSSTDLYNWEDCGLIVPPDEKDTDSPLHPGQYLDRPHIIYNEHSGKFVCWVKVMTKGSIQRSTVLVADSILGPYEIVQTWLRPLSMNAGDFDLVVDPHDGKGYYIFERVHSELIVADLTEDYTDVTGYYSTHFPLEQPPFVREAPSHFLKDRKHYLITSGTTGYYPNPSEVAVAPSIHGPYTILGDPTPSDVSHTTFHSQISSVFKHPGKKNLYIALGDRWLPSYLDDSSRAIDAFTEHFRPGHDGDEPIEEFAEVDTARADYVWLPLRFEGGRVLIDWRDEWSTDEFEDA